MSIVNLHKSKHDEEKKDVNQGGHLRDFELRICLTWVGVSFDIGSPAFCFCKPQQYEKGSRV